MIIDFKDEVELEKFVEIIENNKRTNGLINNISACQELIEKFERGTAEEWGVEQYEDDKITYQNKRYTGFFKYVFPDGKISYSDVYIFEIKNSDDIWKKYPPENDPGSLDDGDPIFKKYFDLRKELENKPNFEITFPYIPKTHYYNWSFEKEIFEEE